MISYRKKLLLLLEWRVWVFYAQNIPLQSYKYAKWSLKNKKLLTYFQNNVSRHKGIIIVCSVKKMLASEYLIESVEHKKGRETYRDWNGNNFLYLYFHVFFISPCFYFFVFKWNCFIFCFSFLLLIVFFCFKNCEIVRYISFYKTFLISVIFAQSKETAFLTFFELFQ